MEDKAAEKFLEEGIDLDEMAKKYETRGFFRRLVGVLKLAGIKG